MKVYCEVVFRLDQQPNGVNADSLFVVVEMPCLVPVGSTVYLPTPAEYKHMAGHMDAIVESYSTCNGLVEANLRLASAAFSLDKFKETKEDLLQIGWSTQEDAAVRKAAEALFVEQPTRKAD